MEDMFRGIFCLHLFTDGFSVQRNFLFTFVYAMSKFGCALDKQSLKNKLVNRETFIYM